MQFGPYSFEVSNRDKVLFPEPGLTKGDLIDHYAAVADVMLPHVRGRPLAMHRFPDGIDGKDFFQKNVPDYFPDWVQTAEVAREEGSIRMVLANNAATLAYLANQACIAPHVFPCRAGNLRHPDRMIFDLDPPAGAFALAVQAAEALRKVLAEQGLPTYLMTTGSEGLHVVVPLRPKAGFDEVRAFARSVCEDLATRFPRALTTELRKAKRKGRLFLDYLRNSYGQHSIAPYGVRALPHAPVATPIDWEELNELPNASRSFNLQNIRNRLDERGDVWSGIGRYAHTLP